MKTVVFAVMVVAHSGDAPVQLAAEPTRALCERDIRETIANGVGYYDASSGVFFCQRKIIRRNP